MPAAQRVAIVGAGWAGLAAAVALQRRGHHTEVFEASRQLGGRARGVPAQLPDGTPVTLDNGQHILVGAYSATLALMREVGVDPDQALLRLPLTLQFPDGQGLRLPDWPAPLDALAGIATARGWSLADKASLLRVTLAWQLVSFRCGNEMTVAALCRRLRPRVMQELIAPLCVSALNTPAERASGQVFLRVLRDALFGVQGGSNLLIPKVDLSALFPRAATQWLAARGGVVHLGTRVERLRQTDAGWQVNGQPFNTVVMATSASDALHLLAHGSALPAHAPAIAQWTRVTQSLQFEAIATVYAHAAAARLPLPMLALRDSEGAPAQFVFDRGQLDGPPGLLAFVVSASQGDKASLQEQVLLQAQRQLGLALQPLQTIVEKRATFACTPSLQRPATHIAPGLLACGDYVDGPYPATLEGAVLSSQRVLLAPG
jgi:squalene-associated FAD-dependent desaturase